MVEIQGAVEGKHGAIVSVGNACVPQFAVGASDAGSTLGTHRDVSLDAIPNDFNPVVRLLYTLDRTLQALCRALGETSGDVSSREF